MAFLSKEKIFTRQWFRAYLLIVLGTFIMSLGFVLFVSPYKLAPGGVYGIAIVLHHLFGLPIGMTALSMDIPLTLLGIRVLGPRFGIKTVVGFTLTAVFVDLVEWAWGSEPLVEGDPLLSSIFGGVLLGLGLGLVFKSKATSGGSDIIAMIGTRFLRIPLGRMLIIVDSTIVLVGLLAFADWKIPLYSWIVIYITGKVIDLVLEGADAERTLFIVSKEHERIRAKIIEDLERGGTIFEGKGLFQSQDKRVIFTVLNRRETEVLKDFIAETDPEAFVTILNAHEIRGEGFRRHGAD